MLTGELKNQADRIWDTFWSGGIANPLEVIEQITYLLFTRRLDDLHEYNVAILRQLDTPFPPFARQRDFAGRVVAIEKLKATRHVSLAELDSLFAALQRRAFRGEL